MYLQKVEVKDLDEVNAFFTQQKLNGPFEFSYLRPNGFNKLYELESDDFESYVLRSRKDNKIQALASLVFKNTLVGGKEEKICWATDLRIAQHRDVISKWTEFFFPLLEERTKFHNAKFTLTVIPQSDLKSLNSLIRPRASRRNIPQYHLVKKFKYVSLHGKLPSFDSLISSIKIKALNHNSLEALCKYLNEKSNNRFLGTKYTPELLLKREENWPDFTLENYYVALDKKKNIVGSFALWNPKKIQQIQLHGLNDEGKNFRTMVKLSHFLKLAKPLPLADEALNINYLTHLYANNSDIFELIANSAYRKSKDAFLLYPKMDDHFTRLPPKSFLSQYFRFGLYAIVPHGMELPKELRLNQFSPPPDLEIALF